MRLLLLLCAFAVAAPAAASSFRDLLEDKVKEAKQLRHATQGVNEDEEAEIGQHAAAVLLGAGELLDNSEIQKYVNRVGWWVAMQSDRPELRWRFAVLDNPNINAFAAPGGYVFITSGLLAQVSTESELAAVLGHEIAHVVRKHHLQAMKKDARFGLVGKLGQELLSDQTRHADDLAKIAAGVKDIYANGLDKRDEFEADRLGVVLAARAGYDGWGLVAVLQKLASLDAGDSHLALLFKTHPPPHKREGRLVELLVPRAEDFEGVTAARRYRQYLTDALSQG